ncbi:MAG: OmcA/MtrC family decaheme c-type cytochrome [Burkholderiales bacterium]
MAVGLAACGGSDDNTTATAPAAPAGGVPATAAAAITAAAAVATNDTATNPTAAFAVVSDAGVPPVTINSPPKINFTVISDGAVMKTLEPGSNARFILAQLVRGTDGAPDQWKSYTSRTEAGEGPAAGKDYVQHYLAIDADGQYSTATSLVYNDDGYYTFTFPIDIKDATKLPPGVTYDPTLTHRIAIQLRYTNAAGEDVQVNPYFDFTIDANGNAVAVTDDTMTRKVVDVSSCNECHDKLALHGGGRVDTQLCVLCHNPSTTDHATGNVVDFKIMIHKIHGGEGLKELFGESYQIQSHVYDTVAYPQDIRNCTKCHDNTKAPQADNWKNVPSRAVCGACHAGIDFAKGTGSTMADAKADVAAKLPPGTSVSSHFPGPLADDSQCVICHNSRNLLLGHALPATADISKRAMSATISGVAISSTDGSVTATFSMADNGVAVTDPAALKEMYFTLAKLVKADPANNISTNWMSYTGRARTKDAAQPPVIQGYSEFWSDGTLTHTGSGVWTYKFGLTNATPAGDIRKIDHVSNVSTVAGAYNKATIPTYANVVAYEPSLTHRVGIEFKTAAGVDNTTNAVFDFVPDGTATAETRNIVSMTTCATCHEGRKIHKGFATEYCVTCHNKNTYEPYSGNSPVNVDLQRVVHKVHYNGTDFVINGESFGAGSGAVAGFPGSGFPGNIKNCETCHKETATKADGTTVLENAANWRTTPTPEACGSCHESTAATSHMTSQTAAGAQCAFCHNPDSTYGLGVKSVHSK